MPKTQEIIERGKRVLMGNYARQPVVMERGRGSHVWDADGKQYLDLFAGFGGCVLGHCHPELIAAASEQAQRLWHVGNTFYTEPQIELAERLNRLAFPGKVFFCHSGAEANEAACKLARLRGTTRAPHRYKIISLNKSFHGRTLAMIAATGNPSVRQGFAPDVEGFIRVDPGDFDALQHAVDEHTAGIILEPIQGEGGVNLYPDGYIAKVRHLCDKHEMTLIFDEVWTGCGRTGRWFAHQHDGIAPDLVTLAKGLGGGLPIGACIALGEAAGALQRGDHGSTFGGNPVSCAAALAVLDTIVADGLLEQVESLGSSWLSDLAAVSAPLLAGARGRGLWIALEVQPGSAPAIEAAARAHGFLVNATGPDAVRIAPPLVLSAAQAATFTTALPAILEAASSAARLSA